MAILDRLRKPKTAEDDKSEQRQPSDVDPRVLMYTTEELDRTSEFAVVDLSSGGTSAGWRVMGKSPDGDIFQLHRNGVDKDGKPVTRIKVRTTEQLIAAQQAHDDNARQTWEQQEAEREEHARAMASRSFELMELRAGTPAAKAAYEASTPRNADGVITGMPDFPDSKN